MSEYDLFLPTPGRGFSLLSAAGHLGHGDISLFVEEIEISRFSLNAELRNFRCHMFFHPLSVSVKLYVPILTGSKNALSAATAERIASLLVFGFSFEGTFSARETNFPAGPSRITS